MHATNTFYKLFQTLPQQDKATCFIASSRYVVCVWEVSRRNRWASGKEWSDVLFTH